MNWVIIYRPVSLEKQVWSKAVSKVVQVNPCKFRILGSLSVESSPGLCSVMLKADTLNKLHLLEIGTSGKIVKHTSDELCPGRPRDVQRYPLIDVLLITPFLE